MVVHEQFSLRHLNTLGVAAYAKKFVECATEDELEEAIRIVSQTSDKHFVLGGGSNVLFREFFDGYVIKVSVMGRLLDRASHGTTLVELGAGEQWHGCVEWTLQHQLCGLENLALIPGTVGAAPIQNIGAYGMEVQSFVEWVDAIELTSGQRTRFSGAQCRFGYRDSIFKNELKNQYLISRVGLRLTRDTPPNTQYKELQRDLEMRGVAQPDARDVFDSVVAIRRRKLPDVRELGNAGSFFKNPVVSRARAETIQSHFSDVPVFGSGERLKIPAAWLIEKVGMKGVRRGDAGVYSRHALVLVNHGSATASDILALAEEIQAAVNETFSIELEFEVNVV